MSDIARSRITAIRMAAAITIATVSAPLRAGTIRHDVAASSYTSLAADPAYAATNRVETNGGTVTGNLVAQRWVVTAAHAVVFENLGTTRFVVNGVEHAASDWIRHPDYAGGSRNPYDVGLLRLAAPVTSVAPAVRFRGESELGAVGTIVGFGLTGTGITGQQPGTGGAKRAGRNTLDALGPAIGYPDTYVLTDFDDPRSAAMSTFGSATPLPLEYYSAAGDSGGGVYVDVNGQAQLAALVSFGARGTGGGVNGTYGDIDGFTRILPFNAWIDDQLAAIYWSGAASGAFHDANGWEDGRAPDAQSIAVFNDPGATRVSFASDTTNKRLRVNRGDVTLELNGRAYAATDDRFEASIVVGTTRDDVASLTLDDGSVHSANVRIHREGTLRVAPSATFAVEQEIAGNGDLTVAGDVTVARLDLRRLVIEGGGGVALGSDAGASTIRRLSISDDAVPGMLDVSNNDLLVQSTPDRFASDLADVTRYVRGSLIRSSAADARRITGLAIFGGTPDPSSIFVKYTYDGDATADGVVNADDYFRIDQSFLSQPADPAYAEGDFNYDGRINADDYFLIDAAFLGQGAPLTGGADSSPLFALPVPGPAPSVLLFCSAAMIASRRRRESDPSPLES